MSMIENWLNSTQSSEKASSQREARFFALAPKIKEDVEKCLRNLSLLKLETDLKQQSEVIGKVLPPPF